MATTIPDLRSDSRNPLTDDFHYSSQNMPNITTDDDVDDIVKLLQRQVKSVTAERDQAWSSIQSLRRDFIEETERSVQEIQARADDLIQGASVHT